MGEALRVLIACEFTGTVRREFDKLGHDVWSCDGDFIEGIQALADRPEPPAPMEYDL